MWCWINIGSFFWGLHYEVVSLLLFSAKSFSFVKQWEDYVWLDNNFGPFHWPLMQLDIKEKPWPNLHKKRPPNPNFKGPLKGAAAAKILLLIIFMRCTEQTLKCTYQCQWGYGHFCKEGRTCCIQVEDTEFSSFHLGMRPLDFEWSHWLYYAECKHQRVRMTTWLKAEATSNTVWLYFERNSL